MKIPWMFMAREFEYYNPEVTQAVNTVIRRGDFINGEEVKLFEKEISALYHSNFVSCANGTDALALCLMNEGVAYKYEVIVPSYTFVATVDAVIRAGAIPIFADVSPETWTITPETVRDLVTDKTLAIVGVSIFGHQIRWEGFEKFGVKLIEDAAQSFACGLRNVLPDYKTFSFHPTKNLGAYGDAGGIIAGLKEDAENLMSIRQHGMSAANKYIYENLGTNSRMDTIQAAVLLQKYKKHVDVQLMRRNIARYYRENLLIKNNLHLSENSHQFVLKFDTNERRNKVKEALTKAEIASCVFYPIPLHRQYPFKIYKKDKVLPVTDELCLTTLAIPISPFLKENEIKHIVETVNEAL